MQRVRRELKRAWHGEAPPCRVNIPVESLESSQRGGTEELPGADPRSAACSKRPSRWACRPAPRSPPRIRRSTFWTWATGTSPSAPTSPSCTSGGSPRVRTCARRSAAADSRRRSERAFGLQCTRRSRSRRATPSPPGQAKVDDYQKAQKARQKYIDDVLKLAEKRQVPATVAPDLVAAAAALIDAIDDLIAGA